MSKKIMGIDWASETHMCYDLENKKTFKISDEFESFKKLSNKYPDYVFVIEEANNNIGEYLTSVGKEVYVLPPYRSKKAREYHDGSGGKNDKLDAKVIALTFKEHPEYCIKAVYDEFVIKLRRFISSYDSISKTHQQLSNKLYALLKNYSPEYLRAVKDYKTQASLFVLKEYTTPERLRTVSNRDIREKGKLRGLRIKTTFDFVNKLRETNYEFMDKVSEKTISLYAGMLLELEKEKKHLKRQIDEFIKNSKYSFITSMPGIGSANAAYLLKIFISHVFSNYRQFQAFCGTAPIIIQSGKKSRTAMRHRCNHKVRALLYFAASNAIKENKCDWARKFYDRKIKEGKSAGLALRALANTMLKIVFSMLKNLKAYDELLFLSRRGKNPSYENYTPESYQFQSSDYSQYPQNISSVVIEFGGLT